MNAIPRSTSIDAPGGGTVCRAAHPICTALAVERILLVLCLIVLAACGPEESPGDRGGPGPNEGTAHPMVGRAAPEFMGDTLTPGGWLRLSSLRHRAVALLFFRPGAPVAMDLVREFTRLREEHGADDIAFMGVVHDSAANIKRFKELRGVTLPILRDPGSITRSYGIGPLETVVLLDSAHVVRFRLDGYAGRGFRPRIRATEKALRALPGISGAAERTIEIVYAEHPRAPLFNVHDIEGRVVDLASLRGRPVVIHFFERDSALSERDLPRLVPVLKEFRALGVAAIGVTPADDDARLRRFLARNGIDYPVVADPGRDILRRYGSSHTPDTFIIDGEGFIRFRERGDRPDRAELTRLQLRVVLGEESTAAIAAGLPAQRFLGDGVCAVCHAGAYRAWLMTPHSVAWDSLGEEETQREGTCVGCHVTGVDRPGGFVDAGTTPHLVNVQCEACHGPGGGQPHGTGPGPGGLRTACAACHTNQFALKFDLDEALRLVAHRDPPDLDRLFSYSDEQRRRMEQMNGRRIETFRSGVPHVGAEACRDCHRKEYTQWNGTAHPAAYARLLQAGRHTDMTCTPCHTTGAGLREGFGDDAAVASMIGVQCEDCHGPGKDHVDAPEALRKATIYGLSASSSSRDIEGVCVVCHDRENDPDFDFARTLPLVRH